MRELAKLLLVICFLGWAGSKPARAQGSEERILLDDANRERTSRGLVPLQWNAPLAAAARAHAALMAQKNTLAHQLPGEPEPVVRAQQAGARFSALAENIAVASSTSEIHAGWMKSPPHRKNLLDPQLNSVGIAVVDQGRQLYAVEDFSRVVAALSLEQQETRLRTKLKEQGIAVSADSADARRVCQLGPKRGTLQRPSYMLRFTSTDLDKLPDQVTQAIHSGRYHLAEAAACMPSNQDNFSEYEAAVVFFE